MAKHVSTPWYRDHFHQIVGGSGKIASVIPAYGKSEKIMRAREQLNGI